MTHDDITNLKIDLNTTNDSLETMHKIFKDPDIDELFRTKRYCFFIQQAVTSEDGQYIPCIAFENNPGYYPMRGNPSKLQTAWKWGTDLKLAERLAQERNDVLGISKVDALTIIMSSMFPR